MIPADTLKLIQDTAVAAQAVKIIDTPDPRVCLVTHAGQFERFPVPPRVRHHQVYSFGDLISLARTCAAPVLWHSHESIRLVMNAEDGRDQAIIPLDESVQFKAIKMLAREEVALTQKQFIAFLRFELGMSRILIQQFRKLDWSETTQSRGNIQHGSEKLGREIEARVQAVDELPESIDVLMPVYANTEMGDELLICACGVEVDVVNQRLGLKPEPNEIASLVDRAQALVRARLTSLVAELKDLPSVPIYYGSP